MFARLNTKCSIAIGSIALTLSAGNMELAVAQLIIGPPANLGPGVNSYEIDQTAVLTEDRLTLWFASGRTPGNHNNHDIYVAKRSNPNDLFTEAQRLGPPVNTSGHEGSLSLSADGLSLYFDDGIPIGGTGLRQGGLGDADIWVARRDEANGKFDYVENLGRPINSEFFDGGPSISKDGLSLFFGSSRPGGSGTADLWVSTRQSVEQPWNEPVNLGPTVNSAAFDIFPAISPDGRILIFDSFRSDGNHALWMTARSSETNSWTEPVRLPSLVNTNRTAFPTFSPDGSTLYYTSDRPGGHGGWDMWQVPLFEQRSVPIDIRGRAYSQDFDAALGADASDIAVELPIGWTARINDSVSLATVSGPFKSGRAILRGDDDVFNGGLAAESDRALVTGVPRRGNGNEFQLHAQVAAGTATQLRLQHDVEAWAGPRKVGTTGEAAFQLLVELHTGSGFKELLDLGTVTTGPTLVVPEDRAIDGNDNAYRAHYDSGWLNGVTLPQDATLRFRWITEISETTRGWAFGLDNVQLELGILGDVNRDGTLGVQDVDVVSRDVWDSSGDPLFDLTNDGRVSRGDVDFLLGLTNRLNGDADFDGEVQFSDFLVLSENLGQSDANWSEGDFDSNGGVGFPDFLILSDNFGGTATIAAAVPEPTSLTLAALTLALLVKGRSRSI